MAKFIPIRNARLSRITGGQRRLSEWLERKLEDDHLLEYGLPVEPRPLHPDFVVVHPNRSVPALEVKDLRVNTLIDGDPGRVSVLGNDGLTSVNSPLMQAHSYELEFVMALEHDPGLRSAAGSPYAGRPFAPGGYAWC